jgi:hypothetical protein
MRLDQMTDADALTRVMVCEGVAVSPKATSRVRFVARRIVALYEDGRKHGLTHAAAFREAWNLVHPLAEQMGAA